MRLDFVNIYGQQSKLGGVQTERRTSSLDSKYRNWRVLFQCLRWILIDAVPSERGTNDPLFGKYRVDVSSGGEQAKKLARVKHRLPMCR